MLFDKLDGTIQHVQPLFRTMKWKSQSLGRVSWIQLVHQVLCKLLLMQGTDLPPAATNPLPPLGNNDFTLPMTTPHDALNAVPPTLENAQDTHTVTMPYSWTNTMLASMVEPKRR